jgi:hypothetical protein
MSKQDGAASLVRSDALLALSAKWRKEADEMDCLGMDRNLHPYERAGYRGGAGRIRRMADELDSANSAICLKTEGHPCPPL